MGGKKVLFMRKGIFAVHLGGRWKVGHSGHRHPLCLRSVCVLQPFLLLCLCLVIGFVWQEDKMHSSVREKGVSGRKEDLRA